MQAKAPQAALPLIIVFVLLFTVFLHATARVAEPAGQVVGASSTVVNSLSHTADALSNGDKASLPEGQAVPVAMIVGGSTAMGDANRQATSASVHNRLTGDAENVPERLAGVTTQRGGSGYWPSEDWSGPVRRTVRHDPIPTPSPMVTPLATGATASVRVPILMYHHIGEVPPGADNIRRDLTVSPTAFAQQMDYLLADGYQTIGLGDLVSRLQDGKPLPGKPVILTFDDGYDDNYDHAYVILRQHGFTGTFFILTDAIGNRGYMSWEQIMTMDRNGMDIESHGRTHDDLATSSKEWATRQIAGSRGILQQKLGHPIYFYCYPSGRYTAETIAILKANGYLAAVSTAYGATHNASSIFNLTRVRVRGADTLQQFIVKLTTAP